MFSRALALGVLLASTAHADRIAIAPIIASGTGSAPLRDGFRASLAGGLVAAGHEVVDSDATVRSTPALASCETDVCLGKLGELVGAAAVVRAKIEVLGSSNFSFRLELVDGIAQRTTALVEDTCSICTTREANESLSRAAESLGRKLPSRPVAKIEQPVTAPVVVVEKPRGMVSTPRSRMFLGLGIASTLVGLGAIGGGAALIAIDGRTSVDAMLQQTTTHTLVPGIVLTTAGALFVAGGGVLLWRAHANRAPRP